MDANSGSVSQLTSDNVELKKSIEELTGSTTGNSEAIVVITTDLDAVENDIAAIGNVITRNTV